MSKRIFSLVTFFITLCYFSSTVFGEPSIKPSASPSSTKQTTQINNQKTDDAVNDAILADEEKSKNQNTNYGHWYFGFFAGSAHLSNNIRNPHNRLPSLTRANYHDGYDAGFNLGFQTSSHFRYNTQYSHIHADIKNVVVSGTTNSALGHANSDAILVNIIYDLKPNHFFVFPYIGIGAGFSHMDINIHHSNLGSVNGGIVTTTRVKDYEYAYQGLIGLAANIGENWMVDLGYRHFCTLKSHRTHKSFQADLLNIAVNYRFV